MGVDAGWGPHTRTGGLPGAKALSRLYRPRRGEAQTGWWLINCSLTSASGSRTLWKERYGAAYSSPGWRKLRTW